MKLQMGYGNPAFLHPYWKNKQFNPNAQPLSYMIGGSTSLKTTIAELHEKYGNADVEDKQIVIGNGATQVLIALLHSLGKPCWANSPYFNRFPIFADYAGVQWDSGKDNVQIITVPNNPDGSTDYIQYSKTAIYDLSYHWEQYGHVTKFNKDIMVFSLAKATGHASTRIGWAVIKDPELATQVENYIEHSTAGVSAEAQYKAESILKTQMTLLDNESSTVFHYGKEVLKKRWDSINTKMEDGQKRPFKILNNEGMFFWAEGECPEVFDCFKGNIFGDSNDKFRLNIGCDSETFDSFLRLL